MLSLFRYTPLWLVFAFGQALAVDSQDYVDHDTMLMDHGGGHMMDYGGAMVMGQNTDTLPMSCTSINDEVEFTVYAGRKYAEKFPGRMFAFDRQEWRVKPCTKITWHFINEDNIRHQFMMHGLPKYIYKSGMFHLEVTGPGKISGTLIVPANDETYLVHCDISQHMEKGMKGQLIVGKGGTSIPSIPGLTPFVIPDDYEEVSAQGAPQSGAQVTPVVPKKIAEPVSVSVPQRAKSTASSSLISGMVVIGLAFLLLTAPMLVKKFDGMSKDEIVRFILQQVNELFKLLLQQLKCAVRIIVAWIQKLSANR